MSPLAAGAAALAAQLTVAAAPALADGPSPVDVFVGFWQWRASDPSLVFLTFILPTGAQKRARKLPRTPVHFPPRSRDLG